MARTMKDLMQTLGKNVSVIAKQTGQDIKSVGQKAVPLVYDTLKNTFTDLNDDITKKGSAIFTDILNGGIKAAEKHLKDVDFKSPVGKFIQRKIKDGEFDSFVHILNAVLKGGRAIFNDPDWYDPGHVSISAIDLFRFDPKTVTDYEYQNVNFLVPHYKNISLSDSAIDQMYDAYTAFYTRMSYLPPQNRNVFKTEIIKILADSADLIAQYFTFLRCQNEKLFKTASIPNNNPIITTLLGSDINVVPAGHVWVKSANKIQLVQPTNIDVNTTRSGYHTATVSNKVWADMTAKISNSVMISRSLFEYTKYLFEGHFYNMKDNSDYPAFMTFWPTAGSSSISNIAQSMMDKADALDALVKSDQAYIAILGLMGIGNVPEIVGVTRDIRSETFVTKLLDDRLLASILNAGMTYGLETPSYKAVSSRAPIYLENKPFMYLADMYYPEVRDWVADTNPIVDLSLGDVGESLKFANGGLTILNIMQSKYATSPIGLVMNQGIYNNMEVNTLAWANWNALYRHAPLSGVPVGGTINELTGEQTRVYTSFREFKLIDFSLSVDILEDNLVLGIASAKDLSDRLTAIENAYGLMK